MVSLLSRMKVRYGKLVAIVSLFTLLSFPMAGIAQNLGTAPAVGKAVQGQQATQVEGAVLNVVNWVCNVICPVIAAGCFVSAAFKYQAANAAHVQHRWWRRLPCGLGRHAIDRVLHRARVRLELVVVSTSTPYFHRPGHSCGLQHL